MTDGLLVNVLVVHFSFITILKDTLILFSSNSNVAHSAFSSMPGMIKIIKKGGIKMKKLGMAIGTLTVGAVVGLGIYQSGTAQADSDLTSEEIKQLVESQYPGKITEFELERENGKVVYEVEVHVNGVEYDLKLDGDTGEVLREKKEYDKPQAMVASTKTGSKDIISHEEAKKIALQKFDGTITEFELDEDDGHLIYEVEMENGNQEAEFEIDAKTGKILEMEIDTDDDDDEDN